MGFVFRLPGLATVTLSPLLRCPLPLRIMQLHHQTRRKGDDAFHGRHRSGDL